MHSKFRKKIALMFDKHVSNFVLQSFYIASSYQNFFFIFLGACDVQGELIYNIYFFNLLFFNLFDIIK